jgi:uncharacterized membrane protein YsdA (DUF1294 family)/cold shock CspA family protein
VAREKGILEDWHDQRGFGFIRRPGGDKIYVHMKSIGKSTERPKAGDILSYQVGTSANGRTAAVDVTIIRPLQSTTAGIAPGKGSKRIAAQSVGREPTAGMRHISMRTAAAATIIVLLGNNIVLGRFPVWVGLLYLIGTVAAFMFYQADKRAAERRAWRAPERRLHLADLTFGIVGGLLAQHVLRHKTHKPGFVMVTALITALHVLTLGLIMFGVYAPGTVGDFFRRTFAG